METSISYVEGVHGEVQTKTATEEVGPGEDSFAF